MNENLNDYATSAQDEPQKETVVQEPEVKEPEVKEEVSSAAKTKLLLTISIIKKTILKINFFIYLNTYIHIFH
jgi:hypothetical protein